MPIPHIIKFGRMIQQHLLAIQHLVKLEREVSATFDADTTPHQIGGADSGTPGAHTTPHKVQREPLM